MIVETSALVAIVLAEPGAGAVVAAIERDSYRSMSAASFVEGSIVLLRERTDDAVAAFERTVQTLQILIVPVDAAQAREAIEAYRRFGRGSGHPARLNFGDCFSYALAKITREPLLATGDDFAQTGIDMVTWQ